MGTNFYLRRKLSEDAKEKLIEAIRNDDYDNIDISFLDLIHIGKMSIGWKFLWDAHNFTYFDSNVKSLHEFLKSGVIEDEYGDVYSYEDFINTLAEREQVIGLLDANSHPNYCRDGTLEHRFEKTFNIKVTNGEFYLRDDSFPVKEYRFTVYCDFS